MGTESSTSVGRTASSEPSSRSRIKTSKRQWKGLLAVVAASLLGPSSHAAQADRRPRSYGEAVELARAYMDEEDAARREAILTKVETWTERLDEIARALRPVPPADSPTGHLAADRFTVPRVRRRMRRLEPRLPGPLPEGASLEVKDGKLHGVAADGKILWSREHPHPEGPIPQLIHNEAGVRATALLFRVRDRDGIAAKWPDGRTLYYKPGPAEEYLNWVYVPEDYDPKRPLGMVIYLHGGAGIDAVNHGAGFPTSRGAVGQLLRGGRHIAVCSGTPRIPISKWTFPESEILFESIIEEYSTRYAIDPHRIYLAGGSMGGYGSWHQAFRHADRFAIIAPMAAGVPAGYWPKLQGTLIYLATGIYDPRGVAGISILQKLRLRVPRALTLINAEYPSGHPRDAAATPQIEALHELIKRTRRDPYTRRVCARGAVRSRPALEPIGLQGDLGREHGAVSASALQLLGLRAGARPRRHPGRRPIPHHAHAGRRRRRREPGRQPLPRAR